MEKIVLTTCLIKIHLKMTRVFLKAHVGSLIWFLIFILLVHLEFLSDRVSRDHAHRNVDPALTLKDVPPQHDNPHTSYRIKTWPCFFGKIFFSFFWSGIRIL